MQGVIACFGLVVLLTILGVRLMVCNEKNKPSTFTLFVAWICFLSAFFFSLLLVFTGAPKELGYGHVSDSAQNYTDLLQTRQLYHVDSEVTGDGKTFVVMVNEINSTGGTGEFYILRVAVPPPVDFYLNGDGVPVKTTAPRIVVHE
jgi:hypothetical protein